MIFIFNMIGTVWTVYTHIRPYSIWYYTVAFIANGAGMVRIYLSQLVTEMSPSHALQTILGILYSLDKMHGRMSLIQHLIVSLASASNSWRTRPECDGIPVQIMAQENALRERTCIWHTNHEGYGFNRQAIKLRACASWQSDNGW